MLAMNTPNQQLESHYRALLTEVLPYEVPILFDNQGFFKIVVDETKKELFQDVINSGRCDKYTIPFEYSIRRNGGKKLRRMSVMHPKSQIDVADFYQAQQNMMMYYCSQSPFSLRYIDKVSDLDYNTLLVREDAVEREENESNVKEVKDDGVEKKYKSYFSYRKYDMNYKFFKSMDFLRLEQKFQYMQRADVAQCFYHIYTHSISWAVKGKAVAKATIGEGNFQNLFDRLMQQANYSETNGILVGPEVSRIFAEIILQRVDNDLVNRMKKKGKSLHTDYDVRRYVDDYMIFTTDRNTAAECLDELKKVLSFYNLYLNESKNELVERPFMSNMACARQYLSDMFKEWTAPLYDAKSRIYSVRYESRTFLKWMHAFAGVATHYGLEYGDLNRYVLSVSKNYLKECVWESVKQGNDSVSHDFVMLFAEFSFSVYSLDMSCTATMRICSLISILMRITKKTLTAMEQQSITDLINREVKRCLDSYNAQKSVDVTTNIEMCNLLSVATQVTGFKLGLELLEKLYSKDTIFNYFQICTALCLIKNVAEYDSIKQRIIDCITTKMNAVDSEERKKDGELTFLIFDLMTCPYLKEKEKDNILKLYDVNLKKEKTISTWRQKIENCKTWFFHWDGIVNIEDYMWKKEYTPDYF
jgi:hypothetical protein